MNLFLILFSFDFSSHIWSSDTPYYMRKKKNCKDYLYVDTFSHYYHCQYATLWTELKRKLQHIGELAGLSIANFLKCHPLIEKEGIFHY